MESFADLLNEQEQASTKRQGSIIDAVVVRVGEDYVVVDAGLKSESMIPVSEFNGEEIHEGDTVPVVLESIESGDGETRLSRDKAKRLEAWAKLEESFNNKENVTGTIIGKVKGGFNVDLGSIRAFLPGSLVDVRPIHESTPFEGKPLEFKVIKLDQKRNNVVVSRRAVIENEHSSEREQILASLQEDQILTGVVKNLTEYGAFVDLGGIDGLLHITDMAWKRVKHPSEIVKQGDTIQVKVLKFDRERSRVSLGLKQLGEDPWTNIAERFPINSDVEGRVTNLTEYGCFVEIQDGVEGLVHVSEMDWTNKNAHPSKVVSVGDIVKVKVLAIEEDRRRISLGLKQCRPNPWVQFAENHSRGDKVTGKIKSITEFGIFIGLEGGIDGLVHLSDLSWDEPGDKAVQKYKKGDEITAVVLQVDSDRDRISLGIKQISDDPFSDYVSAHPKGSIVEGTVESVDARGATVTLAEGITGLLRASDISRDRVDDATSVLHVGDKVEAKLVGVQLKTRQLTLSIKAKDEAEEKEALAHINSEQPQVDTPNSMALAFAAARKDEQ
ncbi:MAG: 30S ribosomal protein S1 [Succinivibrionaceae bacterium]|nr:30S ribosomal protein S1 [Succinivibrionaceae bacterium]